MPHKPDFTGNTRVGVGSKLFPDTPADLVSFAPNDHGFPDSPKIETFVPVSKQAGDDVGLIGGDQDVTRFDKWVEEHPAAPASPADFSGKRAQEIVDWRDGAGALGPLEPSVPLNTPGDPSPAQV